MLLHWQGYGMYVFSSGQKYEGHWEKGKKHGWSIYTVETGAQHATCMASSCPAAEELHTGYSSNVACLHAFLFSQLPGMSAQ